MLILAVWVITLRVCSRKFTFGTITRSEKQLKTVKSCDLTHPTVLQFGTNAVVVQAIAFLFFWLPTWGFLWSWYGTIICNRWEPPWRAVAATSAIDILERLQESLKSVAPTYDPNTWQITMLLPFLQPLRDLREMTGGLTKAFQMTILTSLILVVTLVAHTLRYIIPDL
ncbi:hypothetical protein BY996DRAFT_2976583 [Phakopsora pachyrhizi]|nr:hypothetical protein BY996DRAFT_2976583 [Phakopsora pachyrhizi]